MRTTYPPPFTNFDDVTLSRVVDTDYQNTSGKFMIVFATVNAVVTLGGVNGYAWIQAKVRNQPGAHLGDTQGIFGVGPDTPTGTDIHGTVILTVPPDWYYQFKNGNGVGAYCILDRVTEVT